MNESTRKVFMILASARLLTRDFEDFLSDIDGIDRDQVLRQFSRMKVALRRFEDSIQIDSSEGDLVSSRPMTGGGSRLEITRRDVNYIIKRTGWSNSEAVERITAEIGHMGIGVPDEIVQYNPKEGFQRWLRRLHNAVGAQALLRAVATAAQSSSGSTSAWKLQS